MGWFKHWFGTRYYSLLYGHRDVEDARQWADAILEHWALPPGSVLLDLACGRGRHAALFAEAGMKVTGVDISEASIEEARMNVPEAEFVVHDMREPFRPGTFDAVCCLFTSLGYFDDIADDRAVFRAVRDALKPGGRFVLDFMNTAAVLRDLVTEERIEKEGVGFAIRRSCEHGVLVKCITVQDGPASHRFEERVQALTPDQLEGMALEAGFMVEARTDGPDMVPFDPDRSQRFVLWMRKPRS
ncbi:MAG TPA: methyltransferase domain-containing protein [Flavobacteriales bacterium]|nr:methyltransferase domain-containing protein [Flavobacteriales bacterium]